MAVKNSNESEGSPTVIIRDTKSEIDMKREEAKNERAKYNATVEHQKQIAKLEISKLKLQQSARSKAQSHIAVVGPLYLCILVGGFVTALACGAIPESQISVASALLTLLVTSFMANLRTIISESPETDELDKKKGKSPSENN